MTDDQLHGDIARDASDLRRGVVVNLIGYAIKLANPLLTWAVILLYGSRDYGLFVAAQASLLVVLRVCLFGFDKAILWWTARQPSSSPLAGMGWGLGVVATTSGAAALLASVFAVPLARWHGGDDAAAGLTLMGVSLVPMALTEVLVSAAAGKRRMEATVFVRDGLGTASLAGFGVIFYYAGLRASGLPLAFVFSKLLGLGGSFLLIRRMGPLMLAAQGERVPRALVRYALPYWGSEVASSFLQRMDVLVLAAFSAPEVVGVWGAVTQIANTLRQIRQAFDPIAASIFSEIGARPSPERLRAGFSYATLLVMVTQMPVYAFILLFADQLLGVLGDIYLSGTVPTVILAGCWIVNGAVGLNQHIVNGYGRSDLTLVNVITTIAIEAALLLALIPRFGLSGAAVAVAVAYTFQCVLAATEGWWLSGVWPYDGRIRDALAIGALSSIVAAAAVSSGANHFVVFSAFTGVYAAGTWVQHRRGNLSGVHRSTKVVDALTGVGAQV